MDPSSNFNSGNLPQPRATWKMLLLAIWVSFGAWIANFDSGYSGTVLIMPSFTKAFGQCQKVFDPTSGDLNEQCSLSALRQSLIGVSLLFIALGGALAGFIGSRLGRRRTVTVACGFCIIGAAGMLGTSGNFLHYVVCKCINGVGIGGLMATNIVYGSECVIASKRGLLLGIYNVGLAMGNVAAAAVCAGSAQLNASSDWQWKTPIICQIPLGVILGAGIMMFPESPRWLLLKDKEDQARRSFAILQGVDAYSAEVTVQVQNIQQHIELERAIEASTTWIEIYRGTNLRRTAVSAMILVGLAITGIVFVAAYAALFLSGVGIKSPYLINAIIALCIFGGAFFGPLIIEYGGRRFAMLAGYSIMALSMLIFSSVSTALGSQDRVAQNVVVAFLCLWAFVFGGFIGPSVWLASAEMHSVKLRTFGQANTTLLYNVFAFGAQFWTPYMLNPEYGNLGANVGYFYFGVTIIVLALTFLFVPETSRLTLEQIDDFYLSGGRAWKTSTKKNVFTARQASFETGKLGHERSGFEKDAAR